MLLSEGATPAAVADGLDDMIRSWPLTRSWLCSGACRPGVVAVIRPGGLHGAISKAQDDRTAHGRPVHAGVRRPGQEGRPAAVWLPASSRGAIANAPT